LRRTSGVLPTRAAKSCLIAEEAMANPLNSAGRV
jgi:hypothetical protein